MIRPFRLTRLASGLLAVAIGAALAASGGSPVATEPVVRVLLASLCILAAGRALLADAEISRSARVSGARLGRSAPKRSFLLPLGVCLLALGAWQGFAAIHARGWPLLWLGLASALVAVTYSRGPALRERGFGEAASFFLFGPLPVLAGFVAAAGRVSWLAVAASLPLGLLATACFLAESSERVAADREPRGWAAVFPERTLERVFLFLIAAAYAWVAFGAVRGFYPLLALGVLITIPWPASAYAALRHAVPGETDGRGGVADRAVGAYLAFSGALLLALLLHLSLGEPIV